eukprot:TRINITY_DN17568_c0_g1_i1.p2 TRINITY_DN17568_c0_g1~~TRINITY_DN17568_c0_g1_i1.p2  ORF type:complete len:145 (-),score=24.10 TRINITY_DN17568_c0_g1_i1:46-480(-)
MNSFGDHPYPPSAPVFLPNSAVHEYLEDNAKVFDLHSRIRFQSEVTLVTPLEYSNGHWRWKVRYKDHASCGEERDETFDGVMVCTGRHGGGGYVPTFRGLHSFKGTAIHSSRYKHPEKHGIAGKRVVVVGAFCQKSYTSTTHPL